MSLPPVCILAAGVGSRLGPLTSHFPKCLLPLQQEAAISWIVRQFPEETEFVVAVGYQAKLVMSYLQAAHPDRKFTFVPVGNYQWAGSGPGASLLACRHLLQRDFYLVCSDSLVQLGPELRDTSRDWLAVSFDPPGHLNHYSTAAVNRDNQILAFQNKAQPGVTLSHDTAFTGWAFIHSWETFWKILAEEGQDQEKEFIQAWYDPKRYPRLEAKVAREFWDIGTPQGYDRTQLRFRSKPLGMEKIIKEMTYRVGDRVIKVADGETTYKRWLRGLTLPHAPQIELEPLAERAISYAWIPGETLYQRDCPKTLRRLLDWAEAELWTTDAQSPELPDFRRECRTFYQERTYERVATYLAQRNLEDPEIFALLDDQDWEYLSYAGPTRFHGDFQFDNLILGEDGEFHLIDWRVEFTEGELEWGDPSYDLAKLYGGLRVNYSLVKQGHYGLDPLWHGQSLNQHQLERVFLDWCRNHHYDDLRIRILTGLIWLNMSPLHPGEMGQLFYELGKAELRRYSSQR